MCDHLDGGTGGATNETINAISKSEEWQVSSAANGSWKVFSYETLRGVKSPIDNVYNYFTDITHQSSTSLNNIPAINGIAYTTWQQLSSNVYLFGSENHNAKSEINGKLTFNDGQDMLIAGWRNWNSILEFQ